MNYKIRRTATIEAPLEFVWLALTDYTAYAAWLPGVAGSQILVREGSVLILELRRRQRDRAPQLLEVIEAERGRSLSVSQAGRVRHRGLHGTVRLRPIEDHVELALDLRYQCSLFEPFSHRRWRLAVSERLSALQSRARRLASGEVAARVGESETLLELFAQPGGLELQLGGERYWIAQR